MSDKVQKINLGRSFQSKYSKFSYECARSFVISEISTNETTNQIKCVNDYYLYYTIILMLSDRGEKRNFKKNFSRVLFK